MQLLQAQEMEATLLGFGHREAHGWISKVLIRSRVFIFSSALNQTLLDFLRSVSLAICSARQIDLFVAKDGILLPFSIA